MAWPILGVLREFYPSHRYKSSIRIIMLIVKCFHCFFENSAFGTAPALLSRTNGHLFC